MGLDVGVDKAITRRSRGIGMELAKALGDHQTRSGKNFGI